MISLSQAQALAQTALNHDDEDFVIVPGSTMEREFGWVFFYQSRRYLETGDLTERIVGNGPVIVNRITSQVTIFGSSQPIEHYIEKYQATLGSGSI